MSDSLVQTDAVVVGAGPAGLALAAALVSRGIETVCIAPSFEVWGATYGVWVDELADLEIPFEKVWQRARVSFPRLQPRILAREYAKIDSARLHGQWVNSLRDADALYVGVVVSAFFSGDRHEVELDSGVRIRARQFFDASGHAAKFTERAPTGHAWQSAFGVEFVSNDITLSHNTMGLMDWDSGLENPTTHALTPAFNYVMPMFGEMSSCEYTVLASRPITPLDWIQRRIMSDLGSDEIEIVKVERCIIPMGHSVPRLDQLRVAFGGAASMVHPATGYMIARALRAAPDVADTYLEVRTQTASLRARALWDTIWSTDRVRTHELYRFGLEALLTMDVEETHTFFAAFFDLPQPMWSAYQSGTASPAEVAETMWALFRRVDGRLKAKLVRAGFGRHSAKLLRVLR